jgi:hypothetical protein
MSDGATVADGDFDCPLWVGVAAGDPAPLDGLPRLPAGLTTPVPDRFFSLIVVARARKLQHQVADVC